MKTKLSLFLGSLLLFSQAAMAQTNYTVSAAVPLAGGTNIAVEQVMGTGSSSSDYSSVSGGTITYQPLTWDAANHVYQGANYFTFDVTANGSGSVATTVKWTEGTQPANAINKLGTNSSVKFAKETFVSSSSTTESAISGPFVLSNATNTAITSGQVSGGWLRVYMGLCTGNTSSANGAVDPAGCKTFGANDPHGSYTGTLSFTSTVS